MKDKVADSQETIDAEYAVRFLVTIGQPTVAAAVRDVIKEAQHWREQAAVYLTACERYQEALDGRQ